MESTGALCKREQIFSQISWDRTARWFSALFRGEIDIFDELRQTAGPNFGVIWLPEPLLR